MQFPEKVRIDRSVNATDVTLGAAVREAVERDLANAAA